MALFTCLAKILLFPSLTSIYNPLDEAALEITILSLSGPLPNSIILPKWVTLLGKAQKDTVKVFLPKSLKCKSAYYWLAELQSIALSENLP